MMDEKRGRGKRRPYKDPTEQTPRISLQVKGQARGPRPCISSGRSPQGRGLPALFPLPLSFRPFPGVTGLVRWLENSLLCALRKLRSCVIMVTVAAFLALH